MPEVALVIPPSPFLIDQRVFPHLGILKVAGSLSKGGVPTEILDLSGDVEPERSLSRYIEQNPEVATYGFTASTPQLPSVRQLVKVLREKAPKARTILGGAHATLVAASKGPRATDLMDQLTSLVDVVVSGDGELAVFDALKAPKFKWLHADLLPQEKLDEPPARIYLNLDEYHYEIEGRKATSLVAQFGCPFRCRFCGGRASPCYNRVRDRTVGSVLYEISQLHGMGYSGLMFYDDELNLTRRFSDLMKGIISLNLDLRLRGFVKAELFTDEQAALMYKAGFRWILAGFESGSPRMLKNMGKAASVEENTRCVEIAHKHGLKVKALMSLGHPGECVKSAEETRSWMLQVKPDDFDLTLISVYPGTAYYDQSVKDPATNHWKYVAPETRDALYSKELDFTKSAAYYKGSCDIESTVRTDALTFEDLGNIRRLLDSELRAKLHK